MEFSLHQAPALAALFAMIDTFFPFRYGIILGGGACCGLLFRLPRKLSHYARRRNVFLS